MEKEVVEEENGGDGQEQEAAEEMRRTRRLYTSFLLSTGGGVNGFTLSLGPSLGEFIMTHPDIKVVEQTIHPCLVELSEDPDVVS
ncbi:hypothetical protein C5167_036925 [Papaver somniferum]|uniref:Uncharacterized protein n=1 Tax=Papaver somniferum TaxID=3469 RepID=A0A4Y7I912_PAPSO|nr:hypothetical protein C5167_036925 [Papaver somniferum]